MNRGVTTYDERDDDCDDEQLYGSGAALAMALVVQSFLGYSPRSRPRMIPGYRFRFLFVMTRAFAFSAVVVSYSYEPANDTASFG